MNFLNGVAEARVSQGLVFIEFSLVGPVTLTECRLDNGNFSPCQSITIIIHCSVVQYRCMYIAVLLKCVCFHSSGESPLQFSNLVGAHSVRVRPNGDNCVRRIRRTVEFNVV